jgi:hypothetical protein
MNTDAHDYRPWIVKILDPGAGRFVCSEALGSKFEADQRAACLSLQFRYIYQVSPEGRMTIYRDGKPLAKMAEATFAVQTQMNLPLPVVATARRLKEPKIISLPQSQSAAGVPPAEIRRTSP